MIIIIIICGLDDDLLITIACFFIAERDVFTWTLQCNIKQVPKASAARFLICQTFCTSCTIAKNYSCPTAALLILEIILCRHSFFVVCYEVLSLLKRSKDNS